MNDQPKAPQPTTPAPATELTLREGETLGHAIKRGQYLANVLEEEVFFTYDARRHVFEPKADVTEVFANYVDGYYEAVTELSAKLVASREELRELRTNVLPDMEPSFVTEYKVSPTGQILIGSTVTDDGRAPYAAEAPTEPSVLTEARALLATSYALNTHTKGELAAMVTKLRLVLGAVVEEATEGQRTIGGLEGEVTVLRKSLEAMQRQRNDALNELELSRGRCIGLIEENNNLRSHRDELIAEWKRKREQLQDIATHCGTIQCYLDTIRNITSE